MSRFDHTIGPEDERRIGEHYRRLALVIDSREQQQLAPVVSITVATGRYRRQRREPRVRWLGTPPIGGAA